MMRTVGLSQGADTGAAWEGRARVCVRVRVSYCAYVSVSGRPVASPPVASTPEREAQPLLNEAQPLLNVSVRYVLVKRMNQTLS